MSQDLFEGLEPEQPIRSSVASEAASRAALLLNKLAPLRLSDLAEPVNVLFHVH